ncbi:hypothetical protein NQ527_10050 [Eshraghiella crossota]|nr:hypothetical protein [Butyrivibrio crossotus]UWO50269.1 hypothetical protein NQ527_10050 [Butyrivibrio crossotus]
MIYRYAEIKDLDEIMGLYKEASLNEWCTWDDSYLTPVSAKRT